MYWVTENIRYLRVSVTRFRFCNHANNNADYNIYSIFFSFYIVSVIYILYL